MAIGKKVKEIVDAASEKVSNVSKTKKSKTTKKSETKPKTTKKTTKKKDTKPKTSKTKVTKPKYSARVESMVKEEIVKAKEVKIPPVPTRTTEIAEGTNPAEPINTMAVSVRTPLPNSYRAPNIRR